MSKHLLFDEIGPWTEIKHEIIRKYAAAYSRILTTQRQPFEHVYIDAFAGPGMQVSKRTGEITAGSPLLALQVEPRFTEYYFIDLDGNRIDHLRRLVGERENVHLFTGDCNEVLLRDVLPNVRYEDYRRGLCLLDPKGLHLRWDLIEACAQLRTLDVFLNFPVMDMNRNVFWKDPTGVSPSDIARITAFWGDETWRTVAYQEEKDLFGTKTTRAPLEVIASAFRKRLRIAAGFPFVPEPLPMRNTKGAVLYYLFFAAHNKTGQHIAEDIFNKYRKGGA